jgi:hypothetical protein
MDGLESSIAIYLTVGGSFFIAPQYDLKYEMNEGGTCPDFVALDFSRNEIVVVEVTAAANIFPISDRVKARQARWFHPALRRLELQGIRNWPIRFLGFVRKLDALQKLQEQFADEPDVTFYGIEDASVPWLYWKDRISNGLPDVRRSPA